MRKINTFGDQNGENNPSEPKNGIWAPKSVWLSDSFSDWKFYIDIDGLFSPL
jgi:hypothetical protein